MKQATLMATIGFGVVMLMNTSALAVPVPFLDAAQPGLDAPLTSDAQPTGWGKFVQEFQSWSYGVSGATTVDPASHFLRYRTSLFSDNANAAEMSDTMDWVASVEWSTPATVPGITVLELIAAGGGDPEAFGGDILRFAGTGTTGQYALIASGGTVGTFDNLTGGLLTVHYKSATGRYDFYIDNSLEVADFSSISGDDDLVFIQLRGGSASTNADTFRNLQVGMLVPEPASVTLLAAGVTMILVRRQYHMS